MRKIMLIDSDVQQLKILNEGLSAHFQVLNCSRGEKAMDLYKIFLPQALVLDPNTPGLQENEFIRSVRGLPGGYRIPILAMTKIQNTQVLSDIFSWKVDVVLSKPCAAERVEKKLMEILTLAPTAARRAIQEPTQA